MPPKHLSFVVPVRDGQQDIAFRLRSVRTALDELTDRASEIIVVDDGSRDATGEIVNRLIADVPGLRLVGHPRPRGIEAAGQTGLERAAGEWVFIQETLGIVRLEDLRQLYRLAADPSVVAARTQSQFQPVAPPLLRRLQQWGLSREQVVVFDPPIAAPIAAIQFVRRTHLQTLSNPQGRRCRLESHSKRLTTRHRPRTNGESKSRRS
jgi:cellulose synthase/poly-beta-1,6-N-acetylglucosamine synthase-like glycosyltransferase